MVDDASTDQTASVVDGCADERVVLVRHEVNQGVGAAMRTGYRAALAEGFDLVGKIDADGQMLGCEVSRLAEPLLTGIADYTKGNRFYFRNATKGMPVQRGFGNALLSFMTKAASGYWHVFDAQCGFTIARSAFLRFVDLDGLPDDYFFENAMLIQLNSLNARVVDVPTSTVYGREVSGVSIGRVVLSFPPRLLAGGAGRFWRKHLLTDFGAVGAMTLSGLALSLFGALYGGWHWWLSATSGHLATTGTVMIAVLPIVVGVQLLLQAFSLSVQASPGSAETARYVREILAAGEFDRDSSCKPLKHG